MLHLAATRLFTGYVLSLALGYLPLRRYSLQKRSRGELNDPWKEGLKYDKENDDIFNILGNTRGQQKLWKEDALKKASTRNNFKTNNPTDKCI